MLKIAFCDDETQETRRLEALLEEYAADRGQDFAHTSYQSPVELMAWRRERASTSSFWMS